MEWQKRVGRTGGEWGLFLYTQNWRFHSDAEVIDSEVGERRKDENRTHPVRTIDEATGGNEF